MFVSVTWPFVLHLPDGNIHLKPGRLIELHLPEVQAHAFFSDQKAKAHVRTLEIGSRVAWRSPLFGTCTGRVALLPEGGWLVVRDHSSTGELALIQVGWITDILAEADPVQGQAESKGRESHEVE